MLLQIVVIFRISLQSTGLTNFPKEPLFLLHFSPEVTSDVRKKKRKRKKGSAQTKGAQKSMKLNNDPTMKNISMKRTSICSKMVQKVLHLNVYVMRKGGSEKIQYVVDTLY